MFYISYIILVSFGNRGIVWNHSSTTFTNIYGTWTKHGAIRCTKLRTETNPKEKLHFEVWFKSLDATLYCFTIIPRVEIIVLCEGSRKVFPALSSSRPLPAIQLGRVQSRLIRFSQKFLRIIRIAGWHSLFISLSESTALQQSIQHNSISPTWRW